METTDQYFPTAFFVMVYKVVVTFEFLDGIVMYDNSNERY